MYSTGAGICSGANFELFADINGCYCSLAFELLADINGCYYSLAFKLKANLGFYTYYVNAISKLFRRIIEN